MTRRAVTQARNYADDVEFSAKTRRAATSITCVKCWTRRSKPAHRCSTCPIRLATRRRVNSNISSEQVIERVVRDRDVIVSVHCHNDLGLAVANSLAAIEAGARQVECTINGIGERAGNASLEEIVMALHVRADRLPFETGIVTQQLYPASQLLSSIVGFEVQPNKAIVGRNAFAHEAGIHQHGVINNPLCYEIMTPESVGVPANSLVLGKHSGRHALSLRYMELGYDVSATELDAAYAGFTELADRKKRIYDQDLISL